MTGTDRSSVAVVIVTYNSGRDVGPCLRSLESASSRITRVIVVDNASTDDTAAVVRQHPGPVALVRLERNGGYGQAVNLAVERADAEYVAVVNPDVVSTASWIDRLVVALENDPGAAIATPKILLASDPERINACGNAPHYTGITPCRGFNQPITSYATPEEIAAVSGAAFVVRRVAFEEIGGFDPTFFLYLEDTDLSLRLSMAGYRCLYVPDSLVVHQFAPRFTSDKFFYLERNRHLLLLKILRWRTLLTLAPALLLTELVVWIYAVMGGPAHITGKLRAYSWVNAHRSQIVGARRRTQKLRRVADRALLARCTSALQLDELGASGRLAMFFVNPFFRIWHQAARLVISW